MKKTTFANLGWDNKANGARQMKPFEPKSGFGRQVYLRGEVRRYGLPKQRGRSFFFSTLASVWTFFYIYSPNLQYVPFSTLIPSLALLAYAFARHPSAFRFALKHKPLLGFSALWLAAFVYAVFVELLSGGGAARRLPDTYPIILARVYAECFLVAVGLWAILRARSHSPLADLSKVFFAVVTVQFILVVLMLFMPAWRDYLFLNLLEPIEKLEVGTFRYQTRGYGIASFHLFSYPLFNGLVFFIAAWMAVTRSYWYLGIGLMAVVPIFLNARIGLIFVGIFLVSIIFAVFPRVSTRSLVRGVSVVVLILGCVAGSLMLVISTGLIPATVLNWAWKGIQEYGAILATGESWTLNTLLDTHWYVPQGTTLITGEGQYLYQGDPHGVVASDIGYVNFLFYGGLCFSVLIYAAFALFGLAALRNGSTLLERAIVVAILGALFAAHFKGIIVGANPFMKAAIVLLVVIVLGAGRRGVGTAPSIVGPSEAVATRH